MVQVVQKVSGLKTGFNGIVGEQDDSLVAVSATWVVSNILVVGAGKQYSTIASAVAQAVDGDIIKVDAGTYINDFATITSKITMIGVGGMVNMVATKPPANLKGILTVDNSVTIENFSFSGAAISDADGGNGAGIRYEGGNMVLRNDSFQHNQNGLLAAPVLGLPSNTIILDHDTFNLFRDIFPAACCVLLVCCLATPIPRSLLRGFLFRMVRVADTPIMLTSGRWIP